MQQAPIPANEEHRLARLLEYDILDTLPEQAYDDIALLAARICRTPIALISLVGRERQWFKAEIGLGTRETPRAVSFCAHALLGEEVMVVPDAEQDPRFADNPLVQGGPRIRFYAGAPLVSPDGAALGTLCVIDRQPRQLGEEEAQALAALARQVMAQLELRREVRERQRYQEQLEAANAQLKELAERDELTGLANRRVLLRYLDTELQRARRSGEPTSLILLDVDEFKAYNDTFGHLAGDEVLRRLGGLLPRLLRASDLAARYGGEEFMVLLPNTPNAGALGVAERIRQAVEQGAWPLRPVTVSLGVATRTDPSGGSLSLIEAADQALYKAKQAGRNRVARV